MASSSASFPLDRYFEPVPDEITAQDLSVTGTLPPQLMGIYLHNGPNPPPGSPLPLFADDGMIHGIRLEVRQALLLCHAACAARGKLRFDLR